MGPGDSLPMHVEATYTSGRAAIRVANGVKVPVIIPGPDDVIADLRTVSVAHLLSAGLSSQTPSTSVEQQA